METKQMPGTVEEGYETVKGLIFDQVYKFKRRYGGDMDDLVGEANLAFVRGHRACVAGENTDPSYSTEIRRWVWYTLFDKMRVQRERKKNVVFISTNEVDGGTTDYPEPTKGMFNRGEFLHWLTPDAAVVAGLALNPPPEVEKVAMAKGGSPRNFRSTVRAHLTGAGWTAVRINVAFEEVVGVLGK